MFMKRVLRATMALVVLTLPMLAGCNDNGAPARDGRAGATTDGGPAIGGGGGTGAGTGSGTGGGPAGTGGGSGTGTR